jgi:hypothetical protein
MRWLAGWTGELTVRFRDQSLPVERIMRDEVAQRFGFVRKPVM